MIWIGSYLIKDEDGGVTAFSTAVKAGDIGLAVAEVISFITEEHPDMDKFLITDIGIADADSSQYIGHEWIDPLADDYWPEEEAAL